MFTDEMIKALSAPLDPRHIKPPPRGKFGSYVDGFHIVTEANRIFGFDGWSYAITMLELCSRVETVDAKDKPQIRVGYRCTVRAEVGGVYREGAAVGSGMAQPQNEADAHESALKEAETDALKRALRSFGYTFGLALYDKSDDNANIALPPVERKAPDPDAKISEKTRHALQDLIITAGSDVTTFCRENSLISLADLTNARAAELAAPLKEKKKELA